jgi:phage FluMu gp28-like protein
MTDLTAETTAPAGIDAAIASGALPTGSELPADFDPRKDGMLMAHQVKWIADKSPLKIAVKCRRSGFTFAEAMMDTVIAATARGEGGDNVFYIGDTQEKGREFINYCAHFARVIAGEVLKIDEVVFDDQREDGSTSSIAAFRIKFASGYSIVALSSRPQNIRGLQGIVVIDEAAFHKDVGEVIDACIALLMWGGKIRIISTHNGVMNPYNELVVRTDAGKNDYSLHRITFDEVIENGLYERVKYMNPDIMPFDQWYATIRGGYVDKARMREELDAIPRDSEGSALARVQVEACIDRAVPVLRIQKPEDFKMAPAATRWREMQQWLDSEVAPVLARVDINRRTAIGGDIARKGDAASLWLAQIGGGLKREALFVLEMRNVPFDQMEQVAFFIFDRAGRRWSAALDASGLGMQMAEHAAQKYGGRVAEVAMTDKWYRENGAALITNIEDKAMTVPADDDVVTDICSLAWVKGIVKIPTGHSTTGADGGKRHADGAIAAMLMEHAAGAEPTSTDMRTAGRRLAENPYGEEPPAVVSAGWGAVAGGANIEGFDV